MGDNVVLLRKGRVVQSGSALDLYRAPKDILAARTFSDLNEVPGRIEAGIAKTALGGFPAPGFAAGNEEMIHALARIKSYLDYGMPQAIQIGAIVALRGPQDVVAENAAAKATFEAFFEQAPTFAALLEPGGKVLSANRLAAMGCGYTSEQVVNRLFWVAPWWSPSSALAEQIKAAALGAATGAIVRDEVEYYMVEGTTRWLDLTIRPILNAEGAVVLLAAMGIDVTERRRLRDEVQQLADELSDTCKRTH